MIKTFFPRAALLPFLGALALSGARGAETVAFWAFDEPVGMYPSSTLADQGPGWCTLVLGPGGSLVPGKFGRALSTAEPPPVNYPPGSVLFGLAPAPTPAGRKVEPLNWRNGRFTALLTAGEKHLRKEFTHVNPTDNGLNLGATDWTVEFWFRGEPSRAANNSDEGVVFEIGEGPRGENDRVTALRLDAARHGFVLVNQPANVRVAIPSDADALGRRGRWAHFAFVYRADRHELAHYVDGKPTGAPISLAMKPLAHGDEAYLSIGRDALWQHPLPGAIDELRISRGAVYDGVFTPGTLVAQPQLGAPARKPANLTPLRFAAAEVQRPNAPTPIALGASKHVLIDDALFPRHDGIAFAATPPSKVELAFEVKGAFRKHVVALADEQGQVRLYAPVGQRDRLGVWTSRDGLHFEAPKLSTQEPDYPNATTVDTTGTPSVFLDPLAPPAERWKLVSGDEGRGIFLHVSPDGYTWTRVPTAAISAAPASQSNMFYDDQRGQYVGYHRTDIGRNAFGSTERRFVMTVSDSLQPPWPFKPLTQADYDRAAPTLKLGTVRPWYLDNGPLTPGGIGIEWPAIFIPQPDFDPAATDIYVPKAVKYPWAPDAYLAFPCIYFHYEGTQPATRSTLGEDDRGRGSGPIETQLMTSRDGINWKRYPRPAWLGVGLTDGFDIHQTYMAQGMVRRGDEIWMYSFSTEEYHSGGKKTPNRRGIFRTVHRLDRFVAAEAPYEREVTMTSRPLTFTGKQLVLNVDTAASGYVQVGLQRPDGSPIAGFGLDDCVYVNGNELRYPVEWQGGKTDVSSLAGQPVQVVIRMRGAKLFALEFAL